jgi:hypothetical protein
MFSKEALNDEPIEAVLKANPWRYIHYYFINKFFAK